MASAADKVTKKAEEELNALNMALSEASSRVQSAEETRKVAAATLGELRSVELATGASALARAPKPSVPAEVRDTPRKNGAGGGGGGGVLTPENSFCGSGSRLRPRTTA